MISLQMHARGTAGVRQLVLPKGRAAWACQNAELPPRCLHAALKGMLQEPMGGHGVCRGAALSCPPRRGHVCLLARCQPLQSIHQEEGSIQSASVFAIGRRNGDTENEKGKKNWEWDAKDWWRTSLGRWS